MLQIANYPNSIASYIRALEAIKLMEKHGFIDQQTAKDMDYEISSVYQDVVYFAGEKKSQKE